MAAVKSKRVRKRHVQQVLFRRGGKRRGAGRKPTGTRAREQHSTRPDFKSRFPLHVVIRVVPEVGSLRRRAMYQAIRWASLTALLRERFSINHISLQRTHIHMLVEANDKAALSRGMQGFLISAARNINTALGLQSARAREMSRPVSSRAATTPGRAATPALATASHGSPRRRARLPRRRGKVFADRYHVQVITSPTQARNALKYCLSNWRHHGEDRDGLASTWLVDPFSTAILFPGWLELKDKHFLWPIRATYDPMLVRRPRTWLLAEGWKLAGSISARDVPGKASTAQATAKPAARK